ncbi:MAG: clan AA aspartic protease [Planctomycetaceae bacterium]|jgi:clan AA aspartic protease|nr:clan AA aspartic protease [Planctomycetaceae bacterium]
MGEIHANIILYNQLDLSAVRLGVRKMENVRKMEIRALIDSGVTTLAINNEIKNQLGLLVLETRESCLADGSVENYEFVGPVEIHFKNRSSICRAVVLPNANEVLLGAIPMEEMDVIIDMKNQELIIPPEHPYTARIRV